MLQATRSAGGGGYRKKKAHDNNPRKSVRFGGHQRPNRNHKGQSSPHTSRYNRRNKRKSTVFKPTHAGQSVSSMVQQSVFAQIDNPTNPNQAKYEQYKSMQRRASIAARKKKEQDTIRKTVLYNAKQHQQLINMVKPDTHSKSKPVTPAPPSASHVHPASAAVSPNFGAQHPNDNWVRRVISQRNQKVPMNPLDINVSAALTLDSKSRQHSAVTTPVDKYNPNMASSIRDTLGLSQNELDEYKKQSYPNPKSSATTPDIRPAQSYDHLPYKPARKPSVSFSAAGNAFLTQQNTLRNNNIARAMNIQPHQLFTTPNSRRPSIITRGAQQMQIPTTSAAPIASMMMMIFQSLPQQQKSELLHLMSLSLNINRPKTVTTPILNPAVAAAVDAARKTQQNAPSNRTSLDPPKTIVPHALSTSKSMPAVMEDGGRLTPRTVIQRKTSQNAVVLKDRVQHNHVRDITPQSTEPEHNEFGLYEIRETSEQSKATPLARISDSNSNKPLETERMPSNGPMIGGVLSAIQSQYDTDAIKLAEAEEHEAGSAPPQTEATPHEVVVTPSGSVAIDSDYEDGSESHNYDFDQIHPHLLGDIAGIEPQKSSDKKVRFKDPTPEPREPPPPLLNQLSAGSISLRIEPDVTLERDDTLREEEEHEAEEKNETIIINEEEIQMTALVQEMERILDDDHHNNNNNNNNKGATMGFEKTPEILVPTSSDLIASPKRLLLTGEYIAAKASLDSIDDDGAAESKEKDANSEDTDVRSRMSSKELFVQDVMLALWPEDQPPDPHEEKESHTHTIHSSMDDSDAELSHSSSKTDLEEPSKYMIRLHPSRYQQNRLGSDRMDGSTESAETLTTNTERSKTVEDINTQRIGITPLQSQAIAAASMMDIGIDPHATDDGESDEEDHNYFGQGTPTAVREGTETIQKTLRAVWVRGHTRIGTLIHFVLILVNLVAAVMFVAAVEGYENEGLEYFFTSAFLVDFCVRLYAAKSAFAYLRSTKGIADFVSVMPGVILAITDFNADIPLWTFSFVRAMRVLRVLRLAAHMVNHEDYQEEERMDPIDIDAMEFGNELNEKEAEEQNKKGCCTTKFWVMSKVTYFKLTLVSYLIMVVFVGAGLFACVEGPQSDMDLPTVNSFFESFYFIVCTVTTVGYGDYSPQTEFGQGCVILVIAVAFIVVPHRAAVLARLEFEYADQESEPSVMDFNMDALNEDMSEEVSDEGPRSFLGYCANCAGPRWTHGTEEMPISCMHCFHPVLTPEQVDAWFPDIAEALNEFVTQEQNDLLSLMLDAKEGADNGLLPVFQEMVRGTIDPTMIANANANAANMAMMQQAPPMQPGGMMTKTPSINTGAYTSLFTTPVGGQQYQIDPQLLLASAFANAGAGGPGLHNNVYTDLYGHSDENEMHHNNNHNDQNNMNDISNHPPQTQLEHVPQSTASTVSAAHSLHTRHKSAHSDMVAIEEETSEIVAESPQDAKQRESGMKGHAQQLAIHDKGKATKPLRVCVTPVAAEEEHPPTSPPSSHHPPEAEQEEYHGAGAAHIEYIEYRTPSMEESETLGGFNHMQYGDDDDDDYEEEEEEEEEFIKKKETPVPTPISTATPMSTASNISNRSGHMRKATPAEMPSVRAIKKFSINLNETPLCEEMEEFTPNTATINDSYTYNDFRRITNSMITPEPGGVGSDSIDDSYNDALDDEEEEHHANGHRHDEEKSMKPLRPKSTGDILKKHILNAIHNSNSSANKKNATKDASQKPKRKIKTQIGGSYNANYQYTSTPNETSSDDRSDLSTDYEDEEEDFEEEQMDKSHPKHQLSIIIDSAPKTRDRAHTTKITSSPHRQVFGSIASHQTKKYNSTTRLFHSNANDKMQDDDITPQEYEQIMRLQHKLDKVSASSPKLRRSGKHKRDKNIKPLTPLQQRLSSQHKVEMLTKQILAAKIANEAANSVNNSNNYRHKTTRHRGGSQQTQQHKQHKSKHRAYKSAHLNFRTNTVDFNLNSEESPNLHQQTSAPTDKLAAFREHAAIAKSMTDLFVADTMTKHATKKGKKGKKGSKGALGMGSYNPKEHIANRLVQNIEDQLGADAVPALTSEFITVPKLNTPTLQSPVLAAYDYPNTKKTKKNSKNKAKKNTKKKKSKK